MLLLKTLTLRHTMLMNLFHHRMKYFFSNRKSLRLSNQPVITTRIYVLHKIMIALKFMSYINSDLPIPAKKLQTRG